MNRNWERIAHDYMWAIDRHTYTQDWFCKDPVELYDEERWHDLAAWAHAQSFTAPADLIQLLVKKHSDYGSHNFDRHGISGIQVRIWDKITRYNNLQNQNPNNESLNDTYDDIVGYVILMWMVDKGEMQTPMTLTEHATDGGVFQVHMVTGDGTVLYRKLDESTATTDTSGIAAIKAAFNEQPEEIGRVSTIQTRRWELP